MSVPYLRHTSRGLFQPSYLMFSLLSAFKSSDCIFRRLFCIFEHVAPSGVLFLNLSFSFDSQLFQSAHGYHLCRTKPHGQKSSEPSYFERIVFLYPALCIVAPRQDGGTDVSSEAFKSRSEILLSYNIHLDRFISHKKPNHMFCQTENT